MYLMWTEKQEAQKLKSERALELQKNKDFLSQCRMCVQNRYILNSYSKKVISIDHFITNIQALQKSLWSNFCPGHLLCMHITIYVRAHRHVFLKIIMIDLKFSYVVSLSQLKSCRRRYDRDIILEDMLTLV